MAEKNNGKIAIIIALIGLVGTLGTVLLEREDLFEAIYLKKIKKRRSGYQ